MMADRERLADALCRRFAGRRTVLLSDADRAETIALCEQTAEELRALFGGGMELMPPKLRVIYDMFCATAERLKRRGADDPHMGPPDMGD